MPDVTYYAAASLDGYIATGDGGIDWLSSVHRDGEDYGYARFFASVDGLLMGRATFELARQFDPWPYGTKPCWVWTRRPVGNLPASVTPTDGTPASVLAQAAERGLSHLWLVGGGQLAGDFQARGLISRYVISLVPTVLGHGVPLFGGRDLCHELRLADVQRFPSGLAQLAYVPAGARAHPEQ